MAKTKPATMNLSAQHELFDPDDAKPVTVIGAGSVGSHVVLALAKMGVRDITVYDDDSVDSHNVPMSVYRPRDLMRTKVKALRDIVADATGTNITIHARRYDGSEPLKGSVVCCVDRMSQRQTVWSSVHLRPEIDIFIDTRVNAELIWVFAIDPNDPKDARYYAHHMSYGDAEAANPLCGRHGIAFVSMRTAGAVCSGLTSWWRHGRKNRHHKELAGSLESLK